MSKINIPFSELQRVFQNILTKHGLKEKKAEVCSQIFAVNSLEGIYSHGVNRFPRFIDYIKKGFIDVNAEPERVHAAGAIEQWNGNLAPGPLNAHECTYRAMELAQDNGLGCVAIANTNHWMRGGTYGWQAARKGFVFIGWTNTEANMPAWGGRDVRLGNNPLVIAVPFNGEAIVFDSAMSLFSYGKMEASVIEKQKLPYAGGFNSAGKLTNDPEEILHSRRALPIGYWKGAGLSLMFDILAAVLSAGLTTHEISRNEAEYGVSQVYIAFDLKRLSNFPAIESTISNIIMDFKDSLADENGEITRYPGERVLRTREKNMKAGIPVSTIIWNKIIQM